MIKQLLSSGYTLDELTGVWSRPGYAGISYSDGDEVENSIAEIINAANDLSVLSSELASHCSDWPTLYHLSRKRANLLRPFENQLQNKRVLEVGAGCGAITRYLGESGAEVLALEGSTRRASIVASRCRGLGNVTVVADAFHDFMPACQFDVVTFIGVLEYARKFFPGKGIDPVDAMLAAARIFLKPGGKLIVAIENQLGLKYFAGFPEDHTGKLMFGIEEHYSADSVVTFGRRELGERVARTGLVAQQYWYPFPDYKLPSLVLSEAGAAPEASVDLTSVVRNACIADPQYPPSISFNQERAWGPVIRNGLLRDMANSLLLVASDRDLPQQQELPLAVHYATDRRPEFAKKVVFERSRGSEVLTHQIALYPSAKPGAGSLLKQQLADQPFIKGELWQDRLLQILTSPGWTVEELQEWIKTWFDAFCTVAGIADDRTNTADKTISGKYFDAIPRNMVIAEVGRTVFIDQEWIFLEDLNVWYLSFRALLASLSPIMVVANPFEHESLKVFHLLVCIMRHINIEVTEHRIKKYFELEARLDHSVSGKHSYNSEELVSWFPSFELRVIDTQTPIHEKLGQREEQITTASQALAERNEQFAIVSQSLVRCSEQLAATSQALTQRDQQLVTVGRALAQRDEQLKDVFESSSWHLTRPVRTLKKWLKSGKFGNNQLYRGDILKMPELHGRDSFLHPESSNRTLTWKGDHRCLLDGVEFVLTTDIDTLHKSQSAQDKFLLGKHRLMVEDIFALGTQENIKRIVDIGIFKGGSMALYSLIFAPTKLVGIEYLTTPEEPLEKFIIGRGLQNSVRSYYGTSQADTERIREIINAEFANEALDLVVDDASHLYKETRTSFETLFPLLRPGGIYIIEDWGWAHWQGDLWQKSQIFPAEMPSLTNLLIEISMLCASRPDLVANVQIEPSVIKVRRGGSVFEGDSFKLEEMGLNRGKTFIPVM